MKFIYKREGVEPKSWDFDPGKMLSPEGEAIERLTGLLFDDWIDRVQNGSIVAIHGLLYVLLKRENPTLKWDNVVFSVSEIDWELDDEENARLLEEIEKRVAAGGELTEGQQETYDELKAKVRPSGEDDGPKD